MLGYPFVEAERACGKRLHIHGYDPDKNQLAPLYADQSKVGTSAGLYSTYDILLRCFRENIAPSGGNRDAIRGALVELMHLAFLCNTSEDPDEDFRIDVMHYIFCEMYECMLARKTPPYAPYIMMLIKDKLQDAEIEDACEPHKWKKLYVKKEKVAPPVGASVGSRPSRPTSSTTMAFKKSAIKKLPWWKRTLLCMKIETHKENYSAYRERKAMSFNQKIMFRDLQRLKDPNVELSPEPEPPKYVDYENWNAENINWVEMEEIAMGKKPIPQDDGDDVEDDDEDEDEYEDGDEDDEDEESE